MPESAIAPVREGSRWRYARPSSDEVGAWFADVPIGEGMDPAQYVSGVVIIPAKEKVKLQVRRQNGTMATEESEELTFTPYVRVDMRVAFAYDFAEKRKLVFVKEPAPIQSEGLPPGFWWLGVPQGQSQAKFLCCTMRVAFYREEDWFAAVERSNVGEPLRMPSRPMRSGVATKQIKPLVYSDKIDENLLAKAETGAVGRALGMAGILVVGTGIATAEDMQEVSGAEMPAPALPDAPPQLSAEEIEPRLTALMLRLQTDAPERFEQFSAWWAERATELKVESLHEAPIDVRRGVVSRIERVLRELGETPQPESGDLPPELS